MTTRIRPFVFAILGLSVLLGGPAMAKSDHRIDTVLQSETEAEKHPKTIVHALALPQDVSSKKKAYVCFAYVRDFVERFKAVGTVKMEVEHGRLNEDEDLEVLQTLALNSVKVRKHSAQKCVEGNKKFLEGDLFRVTFTFPNAPRMRGESEDGLGSINLITGFSAQALTMDDFFPPPPPPPPPPPAPTCTGGGSGGTGGTGGTGGGTGGTGGGTGGTGGGTGSSSGDGAAVQRARGCAGSSVGVQFRWEGGRIYFDRRAPGGSVSSVGPYTTLSAAGNAGANAFQCGGGAAVSSADVAEFPRLLSWGGAGGGRLLALRFETSSGSQVYVDAYHSSIGAIHGSPHGSIASAIRAFCSRSDVTC